MEMDSGIIKLLDCWQRQPHMIAIAAARTHGRGPLLKHFGQALGRSKTPV